MILTFEHEVSKPLKLNQVLGYGAVRVDAIRLPPSEAIKRHECMKIHSLSLLSTEVICCYTYSQVAPKEQNKRLWISGVVDTMAAMRISP